MKGDVWYEEYKGCSCTQIEKKKKDLLGYCSRHFNDRKIIIKLPADNFDEEDLGFVEN